MIVTSFDSPMLPTYLKTHERLAPALEAAKKLIAENAEDGKYIIDGDNIYIMISTIETKLPENAKFEVHHNYIDIQLVLEGRELIGFDEYADLEKMDTNKVDCENFFMNEKYDKVYLEKGQFAIIFPEEPHAPGVAADAPSRVRKMVLKIKY